ncbi:MULTISPECIES: pentapeptide repeat-containing protein [unclassified Streptomyces]|uniref:pentapeptide repeat-containing protein n=1 Tax=unclassified Streptomyces TaxID=2593676 RepID=UPI00131CC308|nr:pentapeptide repeat-containing protein [Streptomyces sp. CB01635]
MMTPPPPADPPLAQSLEVTFDDWSEALECSATDCFGRRLATWNPAFESWEAIRTAGNNAEVCLHHADPDQRDAYWGRLVPGAPVDLRRTCITEETLHKLRECLQNRFGDADFLEAEFTQHANFLGAAFTRNARFSWALFAQGARFGGATFSQDTDFQGATFVQSVDFIGATFAKAAYFFETTFAKDANFYQARFAHGAHFNIASFAQDANFYDVTFAQGAYFNGATFREGWVAADLRCATDLSFLRARFDGPVDIRIQARNVNCTMTRWEHSVTLRLHGAHEINLAHRVAGRRAVTRLTLADMARSAEHPFLVLAPDPFLEPGEALDPEDALDGAQDVESAARAVVLENLSGTDTTRMVLTNVDVSRTDFVNVLNLDQIRLEGRCRYLRTPRPGWKRRSTWRRTARNIIAAEDTWRRTRTPQSSSTPVQVAPANATSVAAPASLAPVYRYLRKALEDGKDEPGAADFYYGEMEMRRLDVTRQRAERWLLTLYWAISGYGLRASRALCALLVVMSVSFALLLSFGIPAKETGTSTVGYISADAAVLADTGLKLPDSCTTDDPSRPKCQVVVTAGESVDPTVPTNALVDRFTAERAGKALEVVSSVSLFNADEQELTGWGKAIAFASRFLGALLLGLAALAVRNRVKR